MRLLLQVSRLYFIRARELKKPARGNPNKGYGSRECEGEFGLERPPLA